MKDKRKKQCHEILGFSTKVSSGVGRVRNGVLRLRSLGLFVFVWKRLSFPLVPSTFQSLRTGQRKLSHFAGRLALPVGRWSFEILEGTTVQLQ